MSNNITNLLQAGIGTYTLDDRIDLYKNIFKLENYIDDINAMNDVLPFANSDVYSNMRPLFSDEDDDNDKLCDNNLFDGKHPTQIIKLENLLVQDNTPNIFSPNFKVHGYIKLNENDIMSLIQVPIAMTDILNSCAMCYRILEYTSSSTSMQFQYWITDNQNIFLQIVAALIDNNYVPNKYFDKYITKSHIFKIIRNDNSLMIKLLKSGKMSTEAFYKGLGKEAMPFLVKDDNINIVKEIINEIICCKLFNTQHITSLFYNLIDNDPKIIGKLNSMSLEIVMTYLSTLTTSFQNFGGDLKKIKIHGEILFSFLTSDASIKTITTIYDKIDNNMKMKDILNDEHNKTIFIDKFRCFKPQIIKLICDTKGSTISKSCFSQLLNNLTGPNNDKFLTDSEYCSNFIILLQITQSTIMELIEKEKILKDDIEYVVNLICSVHSDILKQLTLNLIDDFNLYSCVPKEIINALGFDILSTYYKDPSDSKFEVYSIEIVEQIVLANIEFVDYATIITLLSNLYSENSDDPKEIAKIEKFMLSLHSYITKYNVDDVCRMLIGMISTKTTSHNFLEMYFRIVPDVKVNIIDVLCSKLSVELQLQKFAISAAKAENPNNNYGMTNPLVSLYNTLTHYSDVKTTQNNIDNNVNNVDTSPQTILVKLRGINKTNLDIDIQTIENMLNCKTFTNFAVEQHTCKICFSEECQVTLNPCGHLLCEKCATDYVKIKAKCPFCNKTDVTFIKMYYM